MKFIHKERKGPAWVRLCIAGLERTIKRQRELDNPNVIYLQSLETILRAYRDSKVDR